jgi:glycosidase
VSFVVKDKETGENVALSEITADISNLGYKGEEVSFHAESKEGVLYVSRDLEAGEYEVPFTLKDEDGNEMVYNVAVKVVDGGLVSESADFSWDEARVYFLLTDRFANGDTENDYDCMPENAESYHGGDFKGLISKLDYLQELGINTIWITPIVDNIEDIVDIDNNQQAYHGYWAKDFTALDEHLGTVEDLDNLIDGAAERGMKIMVDVVLNHAGYNTLLNSNFKGMLRNASDEKDGDAILSSQYGLPDFKTENAEVRAQLIEWQSAWAAHTTEKGNRIAYFRVDTVKNVDHETWQDFKTAVAKINPSFKMMGEYYGAGVAKNGGYLGDSQMDGVLDFEFKSTAKKFLTGKIESVEAAMEKRNQSITSSLSMGQFLGSHDEDGFLYSIGGNVDKLRIAASLQMTAKGIPVIYYGEEINLSGPNAYGDVNNNRYDMQFDNLTEEQKTTLSHYKKLLYARAQYSEIFAAGDREMIAGSDEEKYLVFERKYYDEAVYVGLNLSEEAVEVSVDVADILGDDTEAKLVDAYSGEEITVENGQAKIKIPAITNGGTVIVGKSN